VTNMIKMLLNAPDLEMGLDEICALVVDMFQKAPCIDGRYKGKASRNHSSEACRHDSSPFVLVLHHQVPYLVSLWSLFGPAGKRDTIESNLFLFVDGGVIFEFLGRLARPNGFSLKYHLRFLPPTHNRRD